MEWTGARYADAPTVEVETWIGAPEVGERWQAGDRDGAAALITDEMVLATTLIGTEQMVRDRLRVPRRPHRHIGSGHRAGRRDWRLLRNRSERTRLMTRTAAVTRLSPSVRDACLSAVGGNECSL